MENSVWRTRARVVAYVDFILSILGFFVVIYLIKTVNMIAVMNSDQTDTEVEKAIIILWILVAIYVLLWGLNFWAAIMLLIATTLGSDPSKALERARFYRNVLIAFSIFTSACGIYGSNWLGLVVTAIIRVTFIYTICKFIQEIRKNSSNASVTAQQQENA